MLTLISTSAPHRPETVAVRALRKRRHALAEAQRMFERGTVDDAASLLWSLARSRAVQLEKESIVATGPASRHRPLS